MKAGVVIRLLVRPSFALTVGVLAVLLGLVCGAEHFLRDAAYAEVRERLNFSLIYHAIMFGGLVSFGGYLGRAAAELEGLRISRTLPGLHYRIDLDLAWIVPAAATLSWVLLVVAIPRDHHALPTGTLWCLNVFLFCLGIGLGWSWIMFVVLIGMALKLSVLVDYFGRAPIASALLALGAGALLLAIRRTRFLAGKHPGVLNLYSLLKSPLSSALSDGRNASLGSRSEPVPAGKATHRSLIQAGLFERMGKHRGGFLSRVVFAAVVFYAIFGLFLVGAAKRHPELSGLEFLARVFADNSFDSQQVIIRILFAALCGITGYTSSLLMDTSLHPGVWHPVSRRGNARARFGSHLRQNLIFAGVHLGLGLGLITGLARATGAQVSVDALRAFLMPSAVVFLLAPIPQALFPRGADTFRGKTDPLIQLGAGLLGGVIGLLTIYWASNWPTKALHDRLSFGAQTALFTSAALVVYGTYRRYLTFRYARADLSRRVL